MRGRPGALAISIISMSVLKESLRITRMLSTKDPRRIVLKSVSRREHRKNAITLTRTLQSSICSTALHSALRPSSLSN